MPSDVVTRPPDPPTPVELQLDLPWDATLKPNFPRTTPIGVAISQSSVGTTIILQSELDTPTTGADLLKYGRISKNPVVSAALQILEAGVFATPWIIRSEHDYKKQPWAEDIDIVLIADIERQIAGLTESSGQPFEMSLRGHARNCWEYGLGVVESAYEKGTRNGKYTVDRVNPWGGYGFDIYVDGSGSLENLVYLEKNAWIQREQLARFGVTPFPYMRNGNWYGQSMLQSVFFDVRVLEVLEQALVQGTNLLAVKPILIWYEQGQPESEIANIEAIMLQLESGGVARMPAQMPLNEDRGTDLLAKTRVEVLEDRASAEGMKSIINAIDMLSKRITRGIGMPDDLGFTSTNVGSLAKAKEETNLFLARISQLQDHIEWGANSAVDSMIRYNWQHIRPDYKWPRFRFDPVKEDKSQTIVETFLPLVERGIITKQQLLDMLEIQAAPEVEPDL